MVSCGDYGKYTLSFGEASSSSRFLPDDEDMKPEKVVSLIKYSGNGLSRTALLSIYSRLVTKAVDAKIAKTSGTITPDVIAKDEKAGQELDCIENMATNVCAAT